MVIFEDKAALAETIDQLKKKGKTIGFVPTMGALHQGHLSLAECSNKETDITVASIFVNPTQFNNPNDLKKYPRTLDADLQMLEKVGCDIVFIPSVTEMYPEEDNREFDFGSIATVMEGEFRPGHFNGVGQIVSKLFDAVSPDKAFFGQKDFQQVAIIKALVRLTNSDVEIVSCPIVREADGLAMSSRNVRLNSEQRKNSALISKTLFEAVKLKKSYTVEQMKKWVINTIDQNPFLETEYFEIVDDTQLQPISAWNDTEKAVGCITVNVGEVRLIDNIYI